MRATGGSAMPDTNTAAAASFQNAEAYEQVMGRWSRRLAPLLIRFGGLSRRPLSAQGAMLYSMTSSARLRSDCDMVRPSVLAAFRLMVSLGLEIVSIGN